MTRTEDYTEAADRILDEAYEEPMPLEDYVEKAFRNPQYASHASKYLLEAIESAGTRTVIEEGDEKERYRFFDDPYNEGEHAILGNTEVLNDIVDDLRSIASERGKTEKMLWVTGPTATGKSELKRCLINGLREYSKTEEGRRYTMEWNIQSLRTSGDPNMGTKETDEDAWYESPVQGHPMLAYPPKIRQDILKDLNEADESHIDTIARGNMDPFSREAARYLEKNYRRSGSENIFSDVTDPKHLRVSNYIMDIGSGIGVLHSEDSGRPKERLVGSWMGGVLRELGSRGRKDARAFSYDGVLSQGNGGLTVIEDAYQHADLVQKLMNVVDEKQVKLDKGITMDIDTQFLVISNPDLEAELNQAEDHDGDPFRALRRRMEKNEFKYLTNYSLEADLLTREVTSQTGVWGADSPDDVDDLITAPLRLHVQDSQKNVYEREIAPHGIEAASLYSVVSRLDGDDVPDDLDLVQKAILFDTGSIEIGNMVYEKDDFEWSDDADEGRTGIPVTQARDALADLLNEGKDRAHAELDVENVILPGDVLDEMVEMLEEEPLYNDDEREEFAERVDVVKEYVHEQQKRDVMDAMLREERADEEAVQEYVEHVYAWVTEDPLENERGEAVDPDPLKMKVFEIEHLGRFDEGDYGGSAEDVDDAIEEFRRDEIVNKLNRQAWENRGEEFQVEDIDVDEIPALGTLLGRYDWGDVKRLYEDFDPRKWADPPKETETERVKDMTIQNMVDMFDYSEASAELTSRNVMLEVENSWD